MELLSQALFYSKPTISLFNLAGAHACNTINVSEERLSENVRPHPHLNDYNVSFKLLHANVVG